jgi:hypothetical protein
MSELEMTKIIRYETRTFEEEIPTTLNGFKSWEFSSGGTTGEDFKIFARKFRNHIKKIMPNATVTVNPNHYYVYGFIEQNSKFVYFSISDVRFFPKQWFNNVLIRTAKNASDYTGGSNGYTTLENFAENVNRLLED